jgi:maltose alpha-D-glucosyltransferase / alpha-amylase
MSTRPTFQIDAPLTQQRLAELTPTLVERAQAHYLATQRWFGDKARRVDTVIPVTQSVVAIGSDLALLLVVRVGFDRGEPVEYFLPLVATQSEPPDESLAVITAADGTWHLIDAVWVDAFRAWLLTSLASNDHDATGAFRWARQPDVDAVIQRAISQPSRVSSAQQSNSSIVYGNEIILKLFRRLSPGINPEVELGRFLSGTTSFRNTPMLLGEWSLTGVDHATTSLAVAQSFVQSVGDGWSFTLDAITSRQDSPESIAGRLGQLTAQMHLALESASGDADLAPELISESDADVWRASTSLAIDQTAASLGSHAGQYSGDTRELIDAFVSQAKQMTSQTSGFDRLIGCTKTRVHGDYHLGQTLRTADDFVILDFEGEPQRPIHERRQKTSPFKDVAGMLRSFGYARGAIERQSPDSDRAALVSWERSARRAFIDQYVLESRDGNARYLPASDDDIRQAIAAWELDKALYEVNYELNNRPDWLALPLAATLKLS